MQFNWQKWLLDIGTNNLLGWQQLLYFFEKSYGCNSLQKNDCCCWALNDSKFNTISMVDVIFPNQNLLPKWIVLILLITLSPGSWFLRVNEMQYNPLQFSREFMFAQNTKFLDKKHIDFSCRIKTKSFVHFNLIHFFSLI